MSTIGVSSSPHSVIAIEPVSSPAPFSTAGAAAIGRRNISAGASGHDGGHAGAGDGLVAVAVPHRDVPDAHARHVGDRVVRSGGDAAEAAVRARGSWSGGGRRHGRETRPVVPHRPPRKGSACVCAHAGTFTGVCASVQRRGAFGRSRKRRYGQGCCLPAVSARYVAASRFGACASQASAISSSRRAMSAASRSTSRAG